MHRQNHRRIEEKKGGMDGEKIVVCVGMILFETNSECSPAMLYAILIIIFFRIIIYLIRFSSSTAPLLLF